MFSSSRPSRAVLGKGFRRRGSALVWAALDVAISVALQAAWYFKWFELSGSRISFRERPWEADNTVDVLHDHNVAYDGKRGHRPGCAPQRPHPTPGTPRHPAYPSGHSTYSAAASTVLGCLFPEYRRSFNRLGKQHRARPDLGRRALVPRITPRANSSARTVGQLVIRQLNESGIRVVAVPDPASADRDALRGLERGFLSDVAHSQGLLRGARSPYRCRGSGRADESGPVIEAQDADADLPPSDDDGELDVDQPEAQGPAPQP
jgi:hypothetical protein